MRASDCPRIGPQEDNAPPVVMRAVCLVQAMSDCVDGCDGEWSISVDES